MIGKAELLELVAGKNRGILATGQDQQAILAAAAALEDRNPNPRPLEAPDLLGGDWRLIYTSSAALLRIESFPLLKLGQIYQCIRPQRSRVYNIAEIYGVPFLDGIVSVAASFEVRSERRVQVKFERSMIGLQSWMGYQSPQTFIEQIESDRRFPPLDFPLNSEQQQGWLDITYLDDDLRISRGNEGSLFILTKP
jgi:hypothetical protein